MTKRISIVAMLLLACASVTEAERLNFQITVGASPVRISAVKLLANRFQIQSRHGNSGLVYILLGVNPTTTCDASNTAHLSAELGPGDATHPGQSLSDPQGAQGNSPPDVEDLSWACIAGTVPGDLVLVTVFRRN